MIPPALPPPFTFAVLLLVETDDQRVSDAISAADRQGTAGVRRAVLRHLPKDVTRVLAVLRTEEARHLMMLHEWGDTAGATSPILAQ